MTELDLMKRTIGEIKVCTAITRNGRNVAKYAIEKQIPKKFVHRRIEYDGMIFSIVHCEFPTCKWIWNTMCDNEEHCVKCGQALDWS